MVDESMIPVLLPIIGVLIIQSMRIKPKKRIVRKEQGASIVKTQGQIETVECFSIFKKITLCPPAMVDCTAYRISFSGGCEDVGDQAFIKSTDREIHTPAVIWTPMPIEYFLSFPGEPVPFYIIPHPADAITKIRFRSVGRIKILPCTKQTFKQVRGLYQVRPVIFPAKGNGFARVSIQPMREYAMI